MIKSITEGTMLYAIYGDHNVYETCCDICGAEYSGFYTDKTEMLALFESKIDAEEYVRRSRLKKKSTFVFRQSSLLRGFKNITIEKYKPWPSEVPINPNDPK